MDSLVSPVTANVGTKDLSCPYCQGLLAVPIYCISFPCRYCKQQIDLGNHTVSPKQRGVGKHRDFYLKKSHHLEVASLYVGNAFIMGKFKGNLYSSGTVKVLEHGELYGKISCRKFMVKKGGVFEGTIQFTHDRILHALPVKNFCQIIIK